MIRNQKAVTHFFACEKCFIGKVPIKTTETPSSIITIVKKCTHCKYHYGLAEASSLKPFIIIPIKFIKVGDKDEKFKEVPDYENRLLGLLKLAKHEMEFGLPQAKRKDLLEHINLVLTTIEKQKESK